MKKRIIPVIMLLIMTLLCGFITVLAAESKTQDGISVSIYTDKEQYKKDESIIVDIVIKNMNSFDLKDVNVRKILPEGVRLSEGIELEETIDVLYAGEERILTATASVDKDFAGGVEESSSEEVSNPENDETPSKENVSQVPQQSEREEKTSESLSQSNNSNQPVTVVETNNVENIAPTINLNIEETQLAFAEEAEPIKEHVIIQSVAEENTELKEQEENVTEIERETAVELTKAEQVPEENSEVIIPEEEIVLADTMSETEDKGSFVNVILIFVIGIGVIGCIAFGCKKGFLTKGLSILLCVSLLTPMVTQLTVNAQELLQKKTLTVEKVIYIDGKEVELQTEISYLLPVSDTDHSGAGGSNEKEKIIYADGVIVDELKEQREYELIEGSDGKHTVIIEKNEATQLIDAGSAFVLPQNEQQLTNVALIAVEVFEKNHQQLEIICKEPSTVGTIIKSIDFEGTAGNIDVNNIEILTEGITLIEQSTDIASYGLGRKRETIDGSVELPDADYKIDLWADIETPEGLSLNGEISFAIPKINAKIVGDFDLLSNTLHEVEVTVTETADVNVDVEVNTDIVEEINPGVAKKINVDIFKIPVPLGACGLISADLVVSLVTDFEGEAHLEFHCEQEQGIRYADNKLEPICRREEPTLDFTAEASGFCGPKVAVNINLLKFCGDLGVFAQLGAGFEFSSEKHVLKGTTTTCNELNVHLAMSVGLNSDTFWVKVIEEQLDTELSIDILTAENSPICKIIHWENGKIVKHCKFSGVIEGYVYNAFDKKPIAGIEMTIQGQGMHPYTKTVNTDENGYYCFEGLVEDIYVIREASEEYAIINAPNGNWINRYNVILGEKIRVVDYEMIPAKGTGGVYIAGTYNGITKEKITDLALGDKAKYTIRQGWYNTDGEILYEAYMKDCLAYYMRLPEGKYTITVSVDGYLDYIENYNVEAGKTMGLDCYLIPMNNMQDDTIVMEYVQYFFNMNPNPARVVIKNEENNNIVVGGSNYQYINEEGDKVIETSSLRMLSAAVLYKPEPGNIYSFTLKIPMRGYYLKTNNTDIINNWGDNVKVYKGGKILKFFNIPVQQGTLTHVFDYDASNDEIIIKNQSYKLQSDYQNIYEILYPESEIAMVSEEEISQGVILMEELSDDSETILTEEEKETVIEEMSEGSSDMDETETITTEAVMEDVSSENNLEPETVTEEITEEIVSEEELVEETKTEEAEEIAKKESSEIEESAEEKAVHSVCDETEDFEVMYENSTSCQDDVVEGLEKAA